MYFITFYLIFDELSHAASSLLFSYQNVLVAYSIARLTETANWSPYFQLWRTYDF